MITNCAIQQLLANPDVQHLHALLADLAKVGGAISIADAAAWELIMGECRSYADEVNGGPWYQTQNNELRLELEGEDEIYEQVSNAIAYLTARGLLLAHPEHPSLVRLAADHAHQA
ncbi:MAG: hypothetical protein AB7P37_21110 [Ramlibacter sp.]